MKYFLIAGEASGDLHGAELIKSIRRFDTQASFAFLGGDLMAAAAETKPVKHYEEMAYMGFVDVAKHLPSIMRIMKSAKAAINEFAPDALILIDYPSFNLKIAKYAHGKGLPVFYFISPKVWVWKEYRVKSIKRYVTRLFSILPFEPAFYRKHGYDAAYVGNPTVKEVNETRPKFRPFDTFCRANGLPSRPIIAIVPGSRQKEIRSNMPVMIEAALRHPDYQLVVAGAPSIKQSLYFEVMDDVGDRIPIVYGQTYELIHHARAAVVCSGTATLETALIGTPQVSCYRMSGNPLIYKAYSMILKGKYTTLPNLITDYPVIPELLVHHCSVDNIDRCLTPLLDATPEREKMLDGYRRMTDLLGTADCTSITAQSIIGAIIPNREL